MSSGSGDYDAAGDAVTAPLAIMALQTTSCTVAIWMQRGGVDDGHGAFACGEMRKGHVV